MILSFIIVGSIIVFIPVYSFFGGVTYRYFYKSWVTHSDPNCTCNECSEESFWVGTAAIFWPITAVISAIYGLICLGAKGPIMLNDVHTRKLERRKALLQHIDKLEHELDMK